MLSVYVLAALVLLAVGYFGLRNVVKTWLKFRGTRVITCPENSQPAAVKVDATHAGVTAGVDAPELRLKSCTRWPERAGCGQECLKQIEAAPADCLVRNILTRWYADKHCVYCAKPLEEIDWTKHKPALLSPEGKTVEWVEVRPEEVPATLATHRPVCWRCHMAQTFRRKHADLVVDRDHTAHRRGVIH
jgi:hypothetical protein